MVSAEPPERLRARRIQSLDRAMDLLRAAAASVTPLTGNELADACGLNRSTAWRMLMTLEYHGMLERDVASQRYTVGHEVLRLAAAGSAQDVLISRARPLIQRLSGEIGETVGLAMATPSGITVVDQSETNGLFGVTLVGRSLPLHASASGKARLAFDSQSVQHLLPEGRLTRYTDKTVTSRGTLDSELRQARKRGYTLEEDEFEAGVSGAAAPVFDASGELRAIVSLWGMTARLGRRRLSSLGATLRATADELTSVLATPQR